MIPTLRLLTYLVLLFCAYGCLEKTDSTNISTSVIPHPVVLETENKTSAITQLNYCEAINDLDRYQGWISSWSYPINCLDNADENVSFINDTSLSYEYELRIQNNDLEIIFASEEGLRGALSTLNQLLELNEGKLPIAKIKDKHRFNYRGMHLDVSRHMFTTEEVKKYIDFLAFYKFNFFHWHLTDDQGWRIEIKKYPLLQEKGAYRDETIIGHNYGANEEYDGKRYGGYYTQEELKEIVAYAHQRGIEVIPEIDVPGHTSAVLSAYPELGCQDKAYKTATRWGVFYDVLCPYEKTFEFLDGVFEELKEIFPSQYVHIGGDECPKDHWNNSSFCKNLMQELNLKNGNELQSHFIKRVSNILASKGKVIIGWDEILEGGLAEGATVMSWRGEAGGIEAAREGHEVIMTPTSHCYFDYYQSKDENEPLAIGGFLPIEKVYNWEVIPKALTQDQQKYILGGQANLWTEYIPDFSKLEYMALARMATLSEVLWSNKEKDFQEFATRLYKHVLFWEKENVNIANHLLDASSGVSVSADDGVIAQVHSPLKSTTINYNSPSDTIFKVLKEGRLELKEKGKYSFIANLGERQGREFQLEFNPHLANYSSIRLNDPPADKYKANGAQSIINGISGSEDSYGGSEWLGFEGKNMDAEISFNSKVNINSISMRFYNAPGQWIYSPSKIEIFSIDDSGAEKLVLETDDFKSIGNTDEIRFEKKLNLSKLRIIVHNFGEIPSGNPGAGHRSWLFVDEIIIN